MTVMSSYTKFIILDFVKHGEEECSDNIAKCGKESVCKYATDVFSITAKSVVSGTDVQSVCRGEI